MKNIKGIFILALAAMMVLAAACSGKSGNTETGTGSENSSVSETGNATESSESGNTDAGENATTDGYVEDDFSVEYTIEAIGTSSWPDPIPEENPVKDYIKEKLNINAEFLGYSSGPDLEQILATRFASGDPPDLAYFADVNAARKLIDQGVILDDWGPYLQYIPTTVSQLSETEKTVRTHNGKLFGIPFSNTANAPVWQTWIRNDWLQKLGIPMPKTTEELFEAARAFTFEDPDGNGKADTWGFTGNGSGVNLGWMDSTLSTLFDIPGLTIIDNKVVPKAIHPNRKEALAYLKRAVDEKIIDPDWYTQEWGAVLNKSSAGQIGIMYMWMLGAQTLIQGGTATGRDTFDRANGEKWEFEDWALMETEGYKSPGAWNLGGGAYVISAEAAKDAGKLRRIFSYIEYMTAPNEGGVELGIGCIPCGGQIKEVGIGKIADWSTTVNPMQLNTYRYFTWVNYGTVVPELGFLQWYAGEDPVVQQKVVDMEDRVRELPTMEEYLPLVKTEEDLVGIVSDLTKFVNQSEIEFALGKKSLDDWDAYVADWLNEYGGQKLLDSYTEQLKTLGIMK